MSKFKKTAEIAATLIEIYGTIQGAADAVGASVSQMHAWKDTKKNKKTEMSGPAARLGRRLIEAYRVRVATMREFIPYTEPPAGIDPILVTIDTYAVPAEGERKLLGRRVLPVDRADIGKAAEDLARQTLEHLAAHDFWINGGRYALLFYRRDETTQRVEVVVIYVDETERPTSDDVWSVFQ